MDDDLSPPGIHYVSRPSDDIAWAQLAERFPPKLVDHLRRATSGHGRASFDASRLAALLSIGPAVVRQGLVSALELGLLDRVVLLAVHRPCGTNLSKDDLEVGACPTDGAELRQEDIDQTELFVRDAPPSRDVPWVLCVHGMNTRGPWQEALSWRIATAYYRSLPVHIYKYGRVEFGVLFRRRQRKMADALAATITRLAGEPQGSRLGPRPDVVAHSFGTWMIGHALVRHPELRVGRVILVASILRPDFPWRTLVERGQVDAILCHRGGRDLPVRLAAYVIPDSGPSGFRGFDPGAPVIDRLEPTFSHSSFFDAKRLHEMFVNHWQRFLRDPATDQTVTPGSPDTHWKPPPGAAPFLVRLMIFAFAGATMSAVVTVFVRGITSFF